MDKDPFDKSYLSCSLEPKSEREMLMLMMNEIRHISRRVEDLSMSQEDIIQNVNTSAPYYQEIKIKLDNVTTSLDELKLKVSAIEEVQDDLCAKQVKVDTYFKIVGAIAILLPTVLVSLFEILFR